MTDAVRTEKGTALVINLTRFGDLLQSQPLFHDLHAEGYRVHLLCLDVFSSALPLLRRVERAWILPGARLMAETERNWRVAAARLLHFARTLRNGARPACVVNLTTTLPARLLTRMVAGENTPVRGFSLEAEGFGRNSGVWASFLNGTTASRQSAPFNLVDMFRMVGSPARAATEVMLASPPPQTHEEAGRLLAAAPRGTAGFVALQLGASEERRQWPARFFAAVGDRLWREQKLFPVLLGTEAEAPLARAYAAAAGQPFLDAVGKTDIGLLAALLTRVRLLITNDTGTMHLAAGLGVPSLALFLASAQPWDTGPYLPGCCCLEPDMECHPCPYGRACSDNLACLERISPQSVGDLALAWLGSGRWENAPLAAIGQEARVWLTTRNDEGFAAVRCLTAHKNADRTLWLEQQRFFWRQILDGMESPAGARGAEEGSVFAGKNCGQDFARSVAPVLDQAVQILEQMEEQGRLLGRNSRIGQLFLRNCERLQHVLDACPPLRSLGGFWRELGQGRGDALHEVLRLVRHLAGHLRQWSAVLRRT